MHARYRSSALYGHASANVARRIAVMLVKAACVRVERRAMAKLVFVGITDRVSVFVSTKQDQKY